MTQTTVSKTFAFATQNGEYWQEFVTQQPEFRADEVTPEEEESIRAAREHVRDAVLDLLEAVMAEVHTRAGSDPWLVLLKTSRRRSTMESDFTLSLPLIKANSLEASVVFVVEVGDLHEGRRPVKLFPAIWRQNQRAPALAAAAQEAGRVLVTSGQRAYVADAGVELVEEATFERIAVQAVDAVWELALAFREKVEPRAPATP